MQEHEGRRIAHRRIGGVPVAIVSDAGLVNCMADDCRRRREGELPRPMTVLDCNGQALSMYATTPDFAAALDAADIVHADGQVIVWLSRLLGGPRVPERTATTDFIGSAARRAAAEGWSFYLLGGSEEINRRCAETLQERNPGLRIAGRRNGYFGPGEEAAVVADIRASGADVVWIGFGKPKEQVFALAHRDAMAAAWIVTCGGCFHFVVGDYARAPRWMQQAGLEWLHRMATGPRYLIGRYLVTIPHALWLVLMRDVLGRGGRPAR